MILILLNKVYPSDIRVDKFCSTFNSHIEFKTLSYKNTNNSYVLLKKISEFELHLYFFSFIWFLRVIFASNNKVKFLLVNDLVLLPTIIISNIFLRKKIVLDMHENFAAMLFFQKKYILQNFSLQNLILFLLYKPSLWSRIEKVTLPFCHKIIVVIEEAKDRILAINLSLSNRIHVVPNYALDFNADVSPSFKSKSIVYAGGFDPATRDIETVINGFGCFCQSSSFKLELIGCSAKRKKVYDKMINDLGVTKSIRIFEWMDLSELEKKLSKFSVGLVPHKKNDHTDTTIPHKIFQYFAQGVPVIVSNCDPLKRLVEHYDTGLVYNAGDVRSFVSCLKQMFSDEEQYHKFSKNCLIATKNHTRWNKLQIEILKIFGE